ncbi:hypothetical protein PGR6_53120 [Pseudomonas sp. GR 6-02]|nr:hypothetical protein PGR6_53120 [Pseudomonas sp. GR 6-02]
MFLDIADGRGDPCHGSFPLGQMGQLCGCLQSIDEQTPGHRARSGLNGSGVMA